MTANVVGSSLSNVNSAPSAPLPEADTSAPLLPLTTADSFADPQRNSHDDADADSSSYVFVNGHDADLVPSSLDLNSTSPAVENTESADELIETPHISAVDEEDDTLILDSHKDAPTFVPEHPSGTTVLLEESETHHHDADPSGSLVAAKQSDSRCCGGDPNETAPDAGESEPNETPVAVMESDPNQLRHHRDVQEQHLLVESTNDKEGSEGSQVSVVQDVEFVVPAESEKKAVRELAVQVGVVQEAQAPSQICPADELDQPPNGEQNVTAEKKSLLAADVAENHESEADVAGKNGLDSNQGKEEAESNNEFPEASPQEAPQMDFEQNSEAAHCLIVADANTDDVDNVGAPSSAERENGLPDGHVQDTVLEASAPNELIDSSRDTSEQSAPPEKGETNNVHLSTTENSTAVSVTEPVHGPCAELGADPVDVHVAMGGQGGQAQQSCSNDEEVPVESCESISIAPICDKGVQLDTSGDTTVETESEDGPVLNDTSLSSQPNDAQSDIETGSVPMESGEDKKSSTVSDFSAGFLEGAGISADVGISADAGNSVGEICVNDSAENIDGSPTSSVDVEAAPQIENSSVAASEHFPDDDDHLESDPKDLNVPSVANNSSCIQPNIVLGDREDQFVSVGNEKEACQAAEDIDEARKDETSGSSVESLQTDVSDGQKASEEVLKRPFYYMIRLPRYDDLELKEQIKQAQFEVDEKTKIREEIQAEIKGKRAVCKELGDDLDAAISEEKAARASVKAKRNEIDCIQSVINRVKSAMSVEDIDDKIRNMEHMIQHETLLLKEEKNFIREIKQLKQLREQHSSNMGSQLEVQQAMDQKDQVEERLKLLRKEVDLLRDQVLKAEARTREAKGKFNEEYLKLPKLYAQSDAANAMRQQAYGRLQSLRKQLYDKNKYFRKYKDDAKAASDMAFKGNKEELQQHCVNQVEGVMELWNENDEFRKDYMRCNLRSTLRRFGTADGRSLGPDEEAPTIPNVSGGLPKENTPSVTIINQAETPALPVISEKMDDKSAAEVGYRLKRTEKSDQTKQTTAQTKKPAKPASLKRDPANISGRDEIDAEKQVETKLSKQEEELAKKEAELAKKEAELRREKETALLKEQQRLEEKAKAKEAMERKKRNAEKAQARATLRAQKEAELKEKEKEKRAKKKEKKKASAVAGETDGIDEEESVPSTEAPTTEKKEPETGEKPADMRKRPQNPQQISKQNKAKSMPPPLRNRGKRKMQTWMWVLLILLAVFLLFVMGNSVGVLVQRLGS